MATQPGHLNRRGETKPHPHNVAGRMDHEIIFVHQISQECVLYFLTVNGGFFSWKISQMNRVGRGRKHWRPGPTLITVCLHPVIPTRREVALSLSLMSKLS